MPRPSDAIWACCNEDGPMIALVLAAGFGTRLRPYTDHTPKPLFTLDRQPLLDIMIRRLSGAGVDTVIVNTHHHHRQIENFLHGQRYGAKIITRHEPVILGTGGAIRNTADIWHSRPLLVVNSDIETDIDFQALYRFHLDQGQPATLALCRHPAFNSVAVDHQGHVVGFRKTSDPGGRSASDLMTFTGVQVMSDTILPYIPPEGFASSIDAYRAMLADGHRLSAYIPDPLRWSDLGTPERYQAAARDIMTAHVLERIDSPRRPAPAKWQALPGDGSDRRWYRLRGGQTRMVVADHGIKPTAAPCEAEAFVAIGNHLRRQGLPVPRIYLEDTFAGLVFMEDLGSENLQARIQSAPHGSVIEADYRRLIDILLDMAIRGGQGFNPDWTYQTRRYDRSVILEKECRYFVEAFLNGYLGMSTAYDQLAPECRRLADAIMPIEPVGFMHRDFQSRNIMVREERFYLIDFQGGRLGPPHYDLASLLIDPYVNLPLALRDTLLGYFAGELHQRTGISAESTQRAYRYCALARNLQILGAYGFLTRTKGKHQFSRYIPSAVESLQHGLAMFDRDEFPRLATIANQNIPQNLVLAPSRQ